MASHSGSEETPIQEVIKDPEVSEIDKDVEVPMFTEEDIDNIMQECDAKLELPCVTKPISSVTDVKENEASECTLTVKTEIQEQQCKAIEKTSGEIKMDLKNNESFIKPESASDSTIPNIQSEIDAIQKHVEESLLFLDHEKEAKNVSGNNEGDAGNSAEIKKNYAGNEVKGHNNEQIASIHEINENLPLDNEQEHAKVVSDKMDDVENKDYLQENMKDNTELTETHTLENKINVNDQPNAMKIIDESPTLTENDIKMEDTETIDKDNNVNTIQENMKNNTEEIDKSKQVDYKPTVLKQESIENASTVREAENDQVSSNINEKVDSELTTIQDEIVKKLPLENIKETDNVDNLEQNIANENTNENSMSSDKITSNVPDSEDVTDSHTVQQSQENAVVEAMDVDEDNILAKTSSKIENTQSLTSSEIHELKEIKTIKPTLIKQEKSETIEVKNIIEVSKCVEDATRKETKAKIINVDEDTIQEDPSKKDLQQVVSKETPTPIQKETQDESHTNILKQSQILPKKLCVWESKNETNPVNKDQSPTAKSINPRPGPSRNIDGPPAKRPRTEPKKLTANEDFDNGDSTPSNDASTQEIAQNVPVPDKAASQDMEPAPHPVMELSKEVHDEFSNWCTSHGIFNAATPQRLPILRRVTLEKAKQENKGVIKLSNLPKSIKQVEQIYHLIYKNVPQTDSDIVEKIAFIHIEKNQFNTAYIKWRDEDLMYVLKAFTLLTRASIKVHENPVEISYDDRSKIEWNADDRPISKKKGSDEWFAKNHRVRLTNAPTQTFAPFTHGCVDVSSKTFGLSKPFLTRLGISLPLNNAVYASNFDEQTNAGTLWSIFCTAGTINSLKVYDKGGYRVARIQYDHPVEAVQAITMFNQQEMNSRIITVKMCNIISPTPDTLVPDGFTKIGPGLGPDGSPMRSVRTTIEVAKLNSILRTLKNKIDIVKSKLAKAVKAQGLKELMKNNQILENNGQTDQDSGEPAMNPAQNPLNAISNKILENKGQTDQFSGEPGMNPAQNPLNAISVLSSVIANSVQSNMMCMLGLQNNPFQGAGQQNLTQNPFTNVQPNWLVPNTDTLNWTPAVDPNSPQMQPNMQPAPKTPEVSNPQSMLSQFINGNMQQGFIQPTFPNMQLVPIMQPILNVQSGVPNPFVQNQPISENVNQAYQPGYPHLLPNDQPTTWNISSAPNNQPTLPNMQPIQTQSNTSNIKLQPQQDVKSDNKKEPPNKTSAKSGIIYDSNQGQPKSQFDIPPVVEPESRVKKIPLPTIPNPTQQIPIVVKRTVQQAAYTKKNPKSSTIKFSIPSLAAVKSYVEAKPSVPKQVPTSSPLPSTSKPLTPEEIWINKQIKALRRNSKSPENIRNVSPKQENIKDETRDSERERENERVKRQNTVIFKYLPASVSTDDLEEKMSEIGKIYDVKSFGKGNASITFRRQADAATCIEMFNKAKVDGQTIEAKWAR